MDPQFCIFRNSPSSSINAESLAFPDADMKRCFMLHKPMLKLEV